MILIEAQQLRYQQRLAFWERRVEGPRGWDRWKDDRRDRRGQSGHSRYRGPEIGDPPTLVHGSGQVTGPLKTRGTDEEASTRVGDFAYAWKRPPTSWPGRLRPSCWPGRPTRPTPNGWASASSAWWLRL